MHTAQVRVDLPRRHNIKKETGPHKLVHYFMDVAEKIVGCLCTIRFTSSRIKVKSHFRNYSCVRLADVSIYLYRFLQVDMY